MTPWVPGLLPAASRFRVRSEVGDKQEAKREELSAKSSFGRSERLSRKDAKSAKLIEFVELRVHWVY